MLEPLVQVSDKTIEHLEEQVKQKPILDIKPLVQGFSLDAIGNKYAIKKYDYFLLILMVTYLSNRKTSKYRIEYYTVL